MIVFNRILSVITLGALLCSDIGFVAERPFHSGHSCLAPWTTFGIPDLSREMLIDLYRKNRLIWIAHGPRYKRLLRRYHGDALLLRSGRYLVSEKTAHDDFLLIRAVTHEDFEILMQETERSSSETYRALFSRIMRDDRIITAYRKLSRHDLKKEKLIFNDIMAAAFEIYFLREHHVASYDTGLTRNEIAFFELMRPVIEEKDGRGAYKNFKKEFYSINDRLPAVLQYQKDAKTRFITTARRKDYEERRPKRNALYTKPVVKNGRLVKGTLIGYFPRNVPPEVLEKNPDCALAEVVVKKSGIVTINNEKLGSKYKPGDHLLIIRKDGRWSKIYNQRGKVQFFKYDRDADNAVYTHPVIKNGKLAGGDFQRAFLYDAGWNDTVGKYKTFALANVTVSGVKFKRFGVVFGMHFGGYRGQKLLVYFENKKPVKIYDAAGKSIEFWGDSGSRNALYVKAKIVDGKRAGGKFVKSFPYKMPGLLTSNPDCVVENCESNALGTLRLGIYTLSQRMPKKVRGYTVEFKAGIPVKMYDPKGKPVPFWGDKDAKNALYVIGKAGKEKFVRSFLNHVPRNILKKYPDSIAKNCEISRTGGFRFGVEFWRHKKGLQGGSGRTVRFVKGDVDTITDPSGNVVYEKAKDAPVSYRLFGKAAIIIDGKVSGGKPLLISRNGFSRKVLEKHPDCIVENARFSTREKNEAFILFERPWVRIKGCKGEKGITAVFRKGGLYELYNKEGRLLWARTRKQDSYVTIFTGGHIEQGKRAGGKPIARRKIGTIVPDSIWDQHEDLIIAIDYIGSSGSIAMFGRKLVNSTPLLAFQEDIIVVKARGRLTAVFAKDGSEIPVKFAGNDEGGAYETRLFDRLLESRDIDRLIKNFGVDGAYRILLRLYDFTPVNLRKFVTGYVRSITEKGFFAPERTLGENTFFDSVGELTIPEDILRKDIDILTDEIVRALYQDIILDHNVLKRLAREKNNKWIGPTLREAYKRAYRYYVNVGNFNIRWINEKAVTLKFYQKMGIKYLMDTKKAILADEPGLGKTIQAIAAALNINNGKGARKVLVVCPKHARQVWEEEIRSKTTGGQTSVILGGGTGKKARKSLDKARFVIVNYEALIGSENRLKAALKQMKFDCIILDEAHKIRNETLQTDAVREFDAPYKFLISGTPLVGRKPSKLFNLVNWLYPNIFKNRAAFSRKYFSTARHLKRLGKDLRSFVLRRDKKSYLDLPQKKYITIPIPLRAEEREVYDAIERNFVEWQKKSRDQRKATLPTLLAKIAKLRQAAIDVRLVSPSFKGGEPSKYLELDKLISEIRQRGEKAVIFSNFRNVVMALRKRYQKMGLTVNYLVGDLGVNEAARQIREFQDKDNPLFIATEKSGGEAITLTAANNVIFIDSSWTVQERDQAVDRVHRIGQTKQVSVYTFQSNDTIDEYIQHVVYESGVVFKLMLEDDPSSEQLSQELVKKVLTRLSYSSKLFERIKDLRTTLRRRFTKRYKEIAVRSTDRKRGIYVEIKGGHIAADLKAADGTALKVRSYEELLARSAGYSPHSRSIIKEAFREGIKEEVLQGTPVKRSMLWMLLGALRREITNIDYHGRLEAEVEAARHVLYLLLERKATTLAGVSEKIKDEDILVRAVYLLDSNNIFKVLSMLGVLDKQFYYANNILSYDQPVAIYPNAGKIQYRDSKIVESIAPGLEDKAQTVLPGNFFEFSSKRYRDLEHDEELRLAREAAKGNVAAEEAILNANGKYVVKTAKSVLAGSYKRFAGTRHNVLHGIDIEELCAQGMSAIAGHLEGYYGEYGAQRFWAYMEPCVRKEIGAYVSAYIGTHLKERAEAIPVGPDGETFSMYEEAAVRETERKDRATEQAGLLTRARQTLLARGFSEDEVDLFMDFSSGMTAPELGRKYSKTKKETESVIEQARLALRSEQAFAEAYHPADDTSGMDKDAEAVSAAFMTLNDYCRMSAVQLKNQVSRLGQNVTNAKEKAIFHLCIPADVFKRSFDIYEVFRKLRLLSPKVKFIFVVYGVDDADKEAINRLETDVMRKNFEVGDNCSFAYISSDEIRERTELLGYPNADKALETVIVKDLYLERLAQQKLRAYEYLALVTGPVSDEKRKKMRLRLYRETGGNVSVRILAGRPGGESLFSLADVMTSWLTDVQNGKSSSLAEILPPVISPEEMIRTLEDNLNGLWNLLNQV
ncbi:MAG: DEAD/DEAH box helicase [Candidatus Omnitrophica bacterium]|nr:DEAD/DEAH box helicase [Candidatus Omnitrophota bacterium]